MSDKLNGFKITCRRIWLSSSLNPKTSTESRKSTSDICIHKHIYRRNSDTGASDTFSIVIHKFIYFWFLLFTKGNHSLNVLFSLYTRVQLWLKFSLTSKRTISVPVLRWQVKKSAVKEVNYAWTLTVNRSRLAGTLELLNRSHGKCFHLHLRFH